MAVTIVGDIYDHISDLISTGITSNVSALMGAISPLMGAALGVYMVYKALEYFYKPSDFPIMETVRIILCLAIVATIGLHSDQYEYYISKPLFNLGDSLASSVSSGSSPANLIDDFIFKIIDSVANLFRSVSDASWATWFTALFVILIIIIASIPFLAICAAYILMTKIMLGLVLSVGCIFICFAFFPSTRNIFQMWTGQILNYVILTLLFSLTISMEINIINEFALDDLNKATQHINSNGGFFSTVLQFLILMTAFIFVTLQLPSLASGLAGGGSISGVMGNMKEGLRSLRGNPVKTTGGSSGKAGLVSKAAKSLFNKITGKGGVGAG